VVAFLLWLILLALSWPLALLVLLLFPVIWLLFLPLRLLGFAVGGAFALASLILFLPLRVLRSKPTRQAG
jgi:hypothetical protein